ncbi:MAG: acylphosphatase [Planctomycetia bacterium]|nr:acylphosphatase [Planctomycetia bacterium]
MDDRSDFICLHAEYTGEVQGVGFRFTTHSIAKRYPVAGFVQNRPNGRVLLVIQGNRSVVHKVLHEIERCFIGHIDDCIKQEKPLNNDLTSFSIRY